MRYSYAPLLIFILLISTNALEAGEYWLQVKELRTSTNSPADTRHAVVVRSLEGLVTSGSPFYIRAVDDGSQALIYGSLKLVSEQVANVEYTYDYAELRSTPHPRRRFNGNIDLTLRKPADLLQTTTNTPDFSPSPNPNIRYVVTVAPFELFTGFRLYSTVSIRLVDEAGNPVANAYAAIYDLENHVLTGDFPPKRSGPNGVVHFRGGRQDLPLYTILAEQRSQGLYAEAYLDRTLSDEDTKHIYTIVMKPSNKPPKILQDPFIASEFLNAESGK